MHYGAAGEVDRALLEQEARVGIVVGVVCLIFCTAIKNALGYGDFLDVFGVHCVGGIIGALGTGILVNPALGGTGVFDYVAGEVGDYDFAAQMTSRLWGVGSDVASIRHQFADPLPDRRCDRRPARHRRKGTRVSTSPSAPSARTA